MQYVDHLPISTNILNRFIFYEKLLLNHWILIATSNYIVFRTLIGLIELIEYKISIFWFHFEQKSLKQNLK